MFWGKLYTLRSRFYHTITKIADLYDNLLTFVTIQSILWSALYGNLYLTERYKMEIIKSMLKEELANSLAMKKNYERELAKLPKGSLIKKNVKGHEYYYLVVREEGKVKFIYKGKEVSDKEIRKYKQAKEYRAKYRKLLSEVKKQIKFLRGASRGKESV